MKLAKFEFSLFGINTYIVYDPTTRECGVIDPGMINEEEREAIVKFIDREQLIVTHLIATHLHIDHSIGIKFVKERYGVGLSANAGDEYLGDRLQEQAQMFGLPMRPDSIKIDNYLEDGDVIKIGKGALKVLHVPGHSKGGIALYDSEGGYVITGDSLFQGSVGRTDLPGGSMTTLIESVREKLMTLPDNVEAYPGHGPATSISRERRYNPYL